MTHPATRLDLATEPDDTFAADVHAGLSARPRNLPCKYLYDAHGSALFEQICELEEYYPTRTELSIMRERVSEMAAALGPDVLLVEYGSGSSTKTRLLLEALRAPAAYVPIDISREHLLVTAGRLRKDFPHIEIAPVVADFTRPLDLPTTGRTPARRVVYFPGSTIGNFTAPEARAFLAGAAELVGRGGGLLIGADLAKDGSILEPAYDDARGVTAAFNLNLLARINRELDGTFDLSAFRHKAVWVPEQGRMELSLVSTRAQMVTVDGQRHAFAEGEEILTEYSHKYTLAGFRELASRSGWTVRRTWTDSREYFSVQYLTVGRP